MTVITILLSIIVICITLLIGVLLKNGNGKSYSAISQVDNCIKVVSRDPFSVKRVLDEMSELRYELVAVHRTKNWSLMLFFTRKTVSNYTKE